MKMSIHSSAALNLLASQRCITFNNCSHTVHSRLECAGMHYSQNRPKEHRCFLPMPTSISAPPAFSTPQPLPYPALPCSSMSAYIQLIRKADIYHHSLLKPCQSEADCPWLVSALLRRSVIIAVVTPTGTVLLDFQRTFNNLQRIPN
jgi:hypothetical protein